MKILTSYQCEKCGFVSTDEKQVIACENTIPLPIDLVIGDKITLLVYGWWDDDESWFIPTEGAEVGSGHNGQGRAGKPIYVVVDIVPKYKLEETVGPSSHEEVAIVYCPSHAGITDRKVVGWTTPHGHLAGTKVGKVSKEELENFRDQIKDIKPRIL